jgi:hypothetical protein
MGMSSYPITLMSSGTLSPARRSPKIKPTAERSLNAMTAVDRCASAATSSAARIPSASVFAPA